MCRFRSGVVTALLLLSAPSISPADIWSMYTNGNFVNSVAMQGDYLWCGTEGGVVRWNTYDMSYVKFTTRDGLKDNYVLKVTISPDGTVWACSEEGVSFYRDGKWNILPLPKARYFEGATDIACGPDGAVWLARTDSVAVYRNNSLTSYSMYDIKKGSSD